MKYTPLLEDGAKAQSSVHKSLLFEQLLLRRKEMENAGECDVDWIQLTGDETGWGCCEQGNDPKSIKGG